MRFLTSGYDISNIANYNFPSISVISIIFLHNILAS